MPGSLGFGQWNRLGMIGKGRLQTLGFYQSKYMGNCFASTKEKPQRSIEFPKRNEPTPAKEEIRLQDFLKIDEQVLRIDSFDINTTSHPAFAQISKDIDRTFPNEQFMKKSENKKTFQRVLRRVALHYPKLGYTQGINFVAGYYLIRGMTEVEAYKSFVASLVHPELMLYGMYQDEFPLVRLYCSLFWSLFKKKCKDFASKVEAISLPDEMWIFQWFICFFIYNLPIEYIFDIYAFILKEKGFALVRLAVSIMIILQKKFKEKSQQFQQEFVQCIEYLKDLEYCIKNVPIGSIIETASQISSKEIEALLQKDSDNLYQKYFLASSPQKKVIYDAFLSDKEKDRKQYFGKVRSGVSIVTYERNRTSVEVIDDIEDRKIKRYHNLLYHSLKERPAHSFIRFERRFSLRDDRPGNFVESIIV